MLSRVFRQALRSGGVVRRLAANVRGSVTVPFALMFVTICVFVGAAVDVSRWLHARQATLSALDAAVLAGGRVLQLNSTDVSGAIVAAKKFYAENTKDRPPVVSDTISFAAADNNTTFRSTGNAYVATPLLSLINVSSIPVLNANGTEFAKANLSTGGQSNGTDLEIALMLDTTGSMAGQKVIDMKAAAKDLVNIVMPDTSNGTTTRMSIVPFSEGVRLPASANAKARGNPLSLGWLLPSPCVVERANGERYTDKGPTGNVVMTLLSLFGSCELGASEELVPLTSNKTTVLNRINGLQTGGGTAGQVGTAWAWYTLSPNFNDLWPSNGASAYGKDTKKIAILMTDGEYNTQYDKNGVDTASSGKAPANDTSPNQARALCSGMKAKGIEVYTIGFQIGNNATAVSTLTNCATDSTKYYNAADGAGLKQAFRDIALKLSTLYLSK